MYTASTAFLEALDEAGVSCIFANLGSDHPPLLEAMAERRAGGRRLPRLITCPHEMVALSAAQGYAQITGEAQAVLVHVDVGTQNLGGALHNAAKGRVPVLILAGASPFTQEGELRGSRNEFIQWQQDIAHQRDIVRSYTRYDTELRTGRNIKQIVHRALQIAMSDPKGPVYLAGPREVLEEEVPPVAIDRARWQPVAPAALPLEGVEEVAGALATAQAPLVVSSYLGRNPAAVAELTRLARRLAVPVLDSVPTCVNFPGDDPLYQGNWWNDPQPSPALAEADLVLVLDSDVPWIPTVGRPRRDARLFHIDIDPLKTQMPLWYIEAHRSFAADAAVALRQINARLEALPIDAAPVAARRARCRDLAVQRCDALRRREQRPAEGLTAEYFLARLRERIDDETIVLNEAISNFKTVIDHLRLTRPGSMLGSGGSLGWNGGAAVGVKLARPEKTVIAVTGDGSYLFSVPASVHWMARRYETPFLQVILNNRGWKSPKLSALAVHPEGAYSRAEDLGVTFEPPPDYVGIAAAAGGAWGRTVRRADEVDAALDEALGAVRRDRRSAVLDVWLPHL